MYRNDCKKQVNEKQTIFAGDLEKVIMLPRMPGFKTSIFNETFAPVGGHGKA